MSDDVIYYTAAAVIGGHNERFGETRSAFVKVVNQMRKTDGLTERVIAAKDTFTREKFSLARAELEVVVACAESAPDHAVISTFSEYVHSGVTKWVAGWAANGWRNKKGEEVKNKDLWQRLLAVASSRKIYWYLDIKADPTTNESKLALEMAMGTEINKEERDDEEEPSFVVTEVERPVPISYGGW